MYIRAWNVRGRKCTVHCAHPPAFPVLSVNRRICVLRGEPSQNPRLLFIYCCVAGDCFLLPGGGGVGVHEF